MKQESQGLSPKGHGEQETQGLSPRLLNGGYVAEGAWLRDEWDRWDEWDGGCAKR